MSTWLSYTQDERLAILQQTSDQESLPDYAVEKDWWVTMVLKAAFQTKCADSLLFKGGTSLSKGWNLIKRFSEDIDLALDHKLFRDNIENNNQFHDTNGFALANILGEGIPPLRGIPERIASQSPHESSSL